MNNSLYTADGLAQRMFPGSDTAFVAACIETIASRQMIHSKKRTITLGDVAEEMKGVDLPFATRGVSPVDLQAAGGHRVSFRWVLPEFKEQVEGFMLINRSKSPFSCLFCGEPSWIDPSDQRPPSVFCMEEDHGISEERAFF